MRQLVSATETQLKSPTLHQLPAGIQCGESHTGSAFSGVETVAAQPQPWQGSAACEAKGAKPAWVLSEATHHAAGPSGPAGEAARCGQLCMEPIVIAEAEPCVEFMFHRLQPFCFSALVSGFIELTPVGRWCEHAGNCLLYTSPSPRD